MFLLEIILYFINFIPVELLPHKNAVSICTKKQDENMLVKFNSFCSIAAEERNQAPRGLTHRQHQKKAAY